MSRKLRLPVPTHVITGSLATGKTTFINQLIKKSKPKDEIWAILVNELGVVGIDQSIISATSGTTDGIHIRELAGGCLCCVLPHVTATSIAQLIRTAKPDRLIIEPSGLAQPSILLKNVLSSPHLSTALDVQPTICLIDIAQPSQWDAPAQCNDDIDKGKSIDDDHHHTIQATQIDIADILVGTKADLCEVDSQSQFLAWAERNHSTKKVFLHGLLDDESNTNELLRQELYKTRECILQFHDQYKTNDENKISIDGSVDHINDNNTMLPTSTAMKRAEKRVWLTNAATDLWSATQSIFNTASEVNSTIDNAAPQPGGRPVRRHAVHNDGDATSNAGAIATCGWIFHQKDVFAADKVEECLSDLAKDTPSIIRMKGLLKIKTITTIKNTDDDALGGVPSPLPAVEDYYLYVNVKGRWLTNTSSPDIHVEEIRSIVTPSSPDGGSRLEFIMAITDTGSHEVPGEKSITQSNVSFLSTRTTGSGGGSYLSEAVRAQNWDVFEKHLIDHCLARV